MMRKSKSCLILLVCNMAILGSVFSQKPTLKKITNESKDPYNQTTKTWEWIFNADGKHVESLIYGQDGRLSSTLSMGYNAFGKIAWEKSLSLINYKGEKDTSGCTTFYIYDHVGHFLRDSTEIFNDHFCMPGAIIKGIVADKIIYDAKDSIVEKINYSFKKKDQILSRTVYTYDALGKKATTLYFHYDNKGILEDKDSTIHFYSENGVHKKDSSFYFTGDSVIYSAVDYDQYGNELQRRRYKTVIIGKKIPKNIPVVFQSDHSYIYDKWGTWIEKNYKTSRGMVGEKIVRTIEYY